MALTSVEVALAAVLDGVVPTASERVALARANGRVLAEDLVARRTQPPFDAAAMDGWALRAEDAPEAGARLAILGESAAGHGFDRAVGPGEAVRIFTGAPIPAGADAIVMQENAGRDGDVLILAEAAVRGRHVRPAGIDFRKGETGLAAGTPIDFTRLGLIAAMNHADVLVHRRPRVALIATGDELVAPGVEPGPDQIVASNGAGISALIEQAGGEVVDLGIVPDDLGAVRAAIARGFEAGVDVLVTLGGASIGDHDLVHRALADEGVAFDFWKIAMRPGKPLMFGRRADVRVLGLPGNPAASLVCSILFLAPLIRALAGRRVENATAESAVLGADLAANDLRQDYLRARLRVDPEGRLVADPVESQDSSLLLRFAHADALIIRPPHAPAARTGEVCRFLRLR